MFCSRSLGNGFNSENISEETKENYERIVPDNSYKINKDYQDVEYPISDIKNESGKSIYIPKKRKTQKEKKF